MPKYLITLHTPRQNVACTVEANNLCNAIKHAFKKSNLFDYENWKLAYWDHNETYTAMEENGGNNICLWAWDNDVSVMAHKINHKRRSIKLALCN